MHPMIGKTFSVKIDGVLRVYEIVKIDDGWISMKREDLKDLRTYMKIYTETS